MDFVVFVGYCVGGLFYGLCDLFGGFLVFFDEDVVGFVDRIEYDLMYLFIFIGKFVGCIG